MLLQHAIGPLPVALFNAALPLLQPLQTQMVIGPAVIEFIQARYRHRQRGESLTNLLLQLAQLRLFEPFILLLDALDLRHLLLQHAGADLAHFGTPLLPCLLQIVMKTLRFLPLGAVQPHHFFVRQLKLQLAPDDASLAPDLNQLIKGDQVFMFFPAHLNACVQQPHAVIRVLSQVFPQRCRFKFHIVAP